MKLVLRVNFDGRVDGLLDLAIARLSQSFEQVATLLLERLHGIVSERVGSLAKE